MPLLGGLAIGVVVAASWFRDASDLGRHALGAVPIGVGGVTALGCSIGQRVSGLFILSAASPAAVAGIGAVAGAVAALRHLAWRVEREDQSPAGSGA